MIEVPLRREPDDLIGKDSDRSSTSPPRQARVITRHADFCLATMPNRHGGGFVAWAKMGNIIGTNPLDEPGPHVWFKFGRTRDEARAQLLAELGLKGFAR